MLETSLINACRPLRLAKKGFSLSLFPTVRARVLSLASPREGLRRSLSRAKSSYDVRTFAQYDSSPEVAWLNSSATREMLGVPADVYFGTRDAPARVEPNVISL